MSEATTHAVSTLGDLIAALETCPQTLQVFFDFCDSIPTTINSYRGYYNQPSLGLALSGYGGTAQRDAPTVADLLAELRRALVDTFTGWKGGDFTYNTGCTLYVDNPGNCSGTKVSGINADDYRVLLLTEREAF